MQLRVWLGTAAIVLPSCSIQDWLMLAASPPAVNLIDSRALYKLNVPLLAAVLSCAPVGVLQGDHRPLLLEVPHHSGTIHLRAYAITQGASSHTCSEVGRSSSYAYCGGLVSSSLSATALQPPAAAAAPHWLAIREPVCLGASAAGGYVYNMYRLLSC